MKTITKSLLLAVMMTLAAGTVFAQVTDPFEVRANVPDRCRISTQAADLDFGEYVPWAAAPNTGTTALGVQCIRGTTATITWAGATASTSAFGPHAMAGGVGANLEYNLEFFYGATQLFSGDAITSLFAANSIAKTIDIDGTLPVGQDEVTPDANYLDIVTVTISF